MSEETQHLGGTDVKATSDETRESEETSEDLESLFDDSEETQEDQPITREELKRLEKGIKKIASVVGRQKEQPKEEKKEEIKTDIQTVNPVLKNLYLKSNPEATLIWDEVEKEAKLLGKDPFTLYESSSYFKGEAKARAEAKEVEEKSKAKINKPSSDTDFSKNIGDVKPEDVEKLPPSKKAEWVRKQAEKERNSDV